MQIVGELRDKRMVDEIVAGIIKLGIPSESQYIPESDMYVIITPSENAEQIEEARDFFRVKMGFKKERKIDQQWVKIKSLPRGEATYILVLVCCFIYGMSFSNMGTSLYSALFIGKIDSGPFYEIIHGQIWRIVTPVLLHMSFMHILFNMLWFKDLGYLLEFNFGKNFLLLFVLLTGIFSNVCQYLVSGPQFGGMSGVLYAMLGFIWVYKKLHSDFEYAIPRFDLGMMIGWYFLCLTGVLGPIANTAHGSGLVIGMTAASAMKFKMEKERMKYLGLALFFLVFTLIVEGYKLNGRYYISLW
jgi:GlpG protein